jgi:hypothetical protein
MGVLSNLREKCLLVKEKWPIVLTPIEEVCYRQTVQMPTSFSPASAIFRFNAPVCASAWRWYWSSTEEASA